MLLYLLRHGIAEDHGSRDRDDERELTTEGKEKTAAALIAAKKMGLFAPQLVLSSPYKRARQTADIALDHFAIGAELEITESLTPETDPVETMAVIAAKAQDTKSILLVGHEPHLSSFGSALLGSTTTVIEMKKATLAKFELTRFDVPRMRGYLVALLPPKIGSI
ncbi:MAG: phosphohistidine phosphatase SixA [bacterium]